jgi:hypothetical protein
VREEGRRKEEGGWREKREGEEKGDSCNNIIRIY